MKIQITNKHISIIVLVFVLFGILPEMFPFISFIPYEMGGRFQGLLKYYLGNVNLNFFRFDLFEYHNFDNNTSCNFINLIFYSLGLLGLIIFIRSHPKETKLIRFTFSVLFIYHAVRLLVSLTFSSFRMLKASAELHDWGMWLGNIAVSVIWIFVAYLVLQKLRENKSVKREEIIESESIGNVVPVSNWLRLFHLVVDTYLCFFLFANYSHLFGGKLLNGIDNILGERGVLLFLLIVYRTIYYPFFEYLIGATPAKLLTGSRVVMSDGSKPKFGTIMVRTLSRYVPFESFSFLFNYGWHDKWTETVVAKETSFGVKGRKYLLIIPLFAAIGLVWYGGHEWNKDRIWDIERKRIHEEKIAFFDSTIKNLSTLDFIKLDETTYTGSDYEVLLKLEDKTEDKWLFRLIKMDSKYTYDWMKVEEQFSIYEYTYGLVEIAPDELLKAYTRDFKEAQKYGRQGIELFNDEKEYEIEEIARRYAPIVGTGSSGMSGGNRMYLGFDNEGWPVDLIDIEIIEGDLEFENVLPERIESNWMSTAFSISFNNYTYGKKYKFQFVLQDTLNNKHVYEVEGKNLDRKVRKVN